MNSPEPGNRTNINLSKPERRAKIETPLRDSTTGGRLFIGTSGWRYASWRGDFYPKGLVQRRELEYLSRQVNSLELNGSFYSLQRPESYDNWREQTPPGFRFAVKGGRYITHMVGPDKLQAALERFFASGVTRLGDRLGPILWQFPARRRFDPDHLETFCAALPRSRDGKRLQHAIEPRHDSFADPRCAQIMNRHRIALAASDGAGEWPTLFMDAATDATAGLVYVRLHGPHELYHGGYSAKELAQWASVIRDLATRGGRATARDAYVYFDNDADGRAPYDALALAELMADTLAG
ncbi:DUF72 domain-containing protein [Gryllotalpicola koreensis]|uniref:DUF72 domain-containing protein n=1 Tax=Gryllotalpicola koreensis TaxID=993086 RepID=UPI0031D8F451